MIPSFTSIALLACVVSLNGVQAGSLRYRHNLPISHNASKNATISGGVASLNSTSLASNGTIFAGNATTTTLSSDVSATACAVSGGVSVSIKTVDHTIDHTVTVTVTAGSNQETGISGAKGLAGSNGDKGSSSVEAHLTSSSANHNTAAAAAATTTTKASGNGGKGSSNGNGDKGSTSTTTTKAGSGSNSEKTSTKNSNSQTTSVSSVKSGSGHGSSGNGNKDLSSSAIESTSTSAASASTTTKASSGAGAAGCPALFTTTTKGSANTNTKGSTSTSTSSAVLSTSSSKVNGTGNAISVGGSGNSTDPQTSLTLDPRVIQPGLNNDGQDVPTAGQVASLVSPNNFINFCETQNTVITNGLQTKTGSCNPIPMGRIIATDKMPSSKFVSPKNLDVIKANTLFTIKLAIKNLDTGSFVNPNTQYYAAPAQVNADGQAIGHSHVVIEKIPSLSSTALTDPRVFTFFKGLNGKDVNGILTADVVGGLEAGVYRMSTINAVANHQPILSAVAQRGAQDDWIYFTVQ